MSASRLCLPALCSRPAAGGASDFEKPFSEHRENLHRLRSLFNLSRRISPPTLAPLYWREEGGAGRAGDLLWKLPSRVLARIFPSHGNIFERKIRRARGQSDSVAASPDEVGPTGRRFRTSGCEIYGLAFLRRRPLAWAPRS
jgi:hypothetical protein